MNLNPLSRDGLLTLLSLGVMIVQSSMLFAEKWWFFELFSHYVWYLIPITVLLFGRALHTRQVGIAALLGIVLLLQLAQIEPWQPLKKHVDAESNFRLLSHNFLLTNKNFDLEKSLIKDQNPDFFIIHEATADWETQLPTYQNYPYQHRSLRPGAWGFAMASRLPTTFEDIVIGFQETVHATVQVEGHPVNIIAFHPMAPISGHFARTRNEDLEALANYIKTLDGPVIVAGDFNLTPWSPYFKKLIQNTGLLKACGKLYCAPTWKKDSWLFRINIDHILVSNDINVNDFEASDAPTAQITSRS